MTVRVTTAKGDAARIVAHYAQLISGDRSLLGLDAAPLAGSCRPRDREWPESEWAGHGATGLGLHGNVTRSTVLALLNGIHPATGAGLGRAFRAPGRSGGSAPSVRGFNATFNAPKSVSVLWAVADGRTRDDIIDGHRAAVRAVLGSPSTFGVRP